MELKSEKRKYIQPKLTAYGDIAEITLGSGRGWKDFVYFGVNDPIGSCKSFSCGSRRVRGWGNKKP